MKKILLILTLVAVLHRMSAAQEVYNYLLDATTRTVNNPMSSYTQTRIAQFKRTALIYMKAKAFETMPEVTEQFLNTQAYYLSEFVTLFFDEIIKDKKLSERKRKQKVCLFMDASKSFPLFGDTDSETTDAYILEGNELTPFSLDTDWQRAYVGVKNVLDGKTDYYEKKD